MKKRITNLLLSSLLLSFSLAVNAQTTIGFDPSSWRIGSQAYTFRLYSLEETLGKLKSCGVKYVELYPGQKITKAGEATTNFNATAAEREAIKKMLKAYDIKAVCYGVVTGKNEEEWRKIFDFAKEIGVEHINTEPPFNQLELLDKICKEYNIKAALHNHPVPSVYWHPRILVDQLKGRSNMIGVCGDVGHWVRSGLNPIDCLKELEGRIIGFHFKDLNVFGSKNAHDVPWGTGNSNIAGVMNELKRQGFKGYFSVEYEYKWENNLPEVKESVDYFNRVVNQLAKEK